MIPKDLVLRHVCTKTLQSLLWSKVFQSIFSGFFNILFLQIIGALTASLVNASVGILIGYAAIALPELKLNKIQASWFASLDMFSCMVFAPIGGLLSGWLGRKKIMMAFSPLAVIGWVLIANQNSELMLFSGRLLSSIAIASMMASPSKFLYSTK